MVAPLVADRYRILDRIGEGGIGVVYRVEDLVEHEVRALKVMPRASGRANLRGEFLALARLRHDNIVRVFDYGITRAGDDYFTMELVRGPNLRAAASGETGPRFYRLVGGVLRALAFIHARGMVHADVKPSNVLVDEAALADDPARAAKLLDFGLAGITSDPASAASRGTFPYAAPEVYAGRLDARSDLYALGVLLYELVTGQPPWTGDVVDVIRRQRQSAPPDPRSVKADVPDGLAELILALTDPEPGARLQSADEALARVNEIGGTDFELAAEKPHLDLNGGLVGRDRDLAELVSLWEGAKNGAGAVALVVGEDGIGKSRLLGELKLRVQLAGGRFYGAAAAARPDAPYAGLADIVRGVLVDLGERHAQRVDPRRPALAPLFGAQKLTAGAESRYALAEAVAGLLLDLSTVEPLVLALDDLDAAERGTLDLFAYLARAAPSGRLLLCGAGRDDAAITRLAGSLAHVERLKRFDLPPLDRTSVRTMVSGMLGPEIADALAVDLHRNSGGNPSILEHALSTLVEQGVIGRTRGKWILHDPHPVIPLPGDAVATAQARAAALPDEVKNALEAAAVLGDRFDYSTLAAVLGAADTTDGGAAVTEALGAAISARLIESEQGGEAFVFTRAGLRDAIYQAIDPPRRAAFHRAAAAALEGRAHAGTRIPPAALAHHYLALGDRDRAVRYALAAADERLGAFDHHGAIYWFEKLGPLVEGDKKLACTVDEKAGDAFSATGELTAAAEHYRRAHDRGGLDNAGHVRVARKLAESIRRRGDSDEAISWLMRALTRARGARLPGEEAECHYALARLRMYRAEYPAAVEHASAGLVLARAAGRRDLAALLLCNRADIETFRGDAKAALSHIEAAVADAGDATERTLADVYHTLGRASVLAGDYPRAIESLERAITVYQRVGHVEAEAKAHCNQGAACYFQGEWARARTSFERYLHLSERMDNPQEMVLALNNLGKLLLDLGQFSEAMSILERARVIAERTGRSHIAAMILGNRGEILFRQGDFTGARECYERCLKLFESLGAGEDLIETRRRLSELDLAAGRVEAALDRAIDAARDAQQAGNKLEEGILHRVAAAGLRQQGDLDSAQWFLERAREIVEGLGAGYERAKVDAETAELNVARGKPAEAQAALQRAIDTFAALGARWDLARARERKRALAAPTISAAEGKLSRSGFEVLLDVALASGKMELERLLEIVLDKILQVTRFERGFILLLDERGRPTERMRRTRTPDAVIFDKADSEFSGSIVRRVAQTGEAVVVTDIADDAALREQKSVISLGLRSVMCAPMRRQGRVTGIVYVDSRRLADEDRAGDLALLEALASQAAIAVENARLVAEEQRKTELMAILAHEIRNPLAGILGFSELLPDEKLEMPARFVNLINRIHTDAQRLHRIVDNVLELARVEAGKVEWSMAPVQVPDLLRDVVAAYVGLAGKKGVELKVEAEPDTPLVLANADRLFQVLSNLIGNALKFTPSGGSVILCARGETMTAVLGGTAVATSEGDDLTAWVPLMPGAGEERSFVRIDVRDTGPGIPAERRERLFEKFAQGEEGKKISRGVGLGLFISREIVRRHGGTIWVESEPGKGSTFSFRIPAAA